MIINKDCHTYLGNGTRAAAALRSNHYRQVSIYNNHFCFLLISADKIDGKKLIEEQDVP